ncbi:MAG TPA: hypothetical protein VER03_18195 [Bryobacteraceae bacterium]|nr:hypothetical protein [Bryobacteraceae bacterium]
MRSGQVYPLLFLSTIAATAIFAADEVINFQFGQPTAWSLEQAHYLLSRMRHDNLDLPTRKPSADDLSTNKVNNNRVQMLQTLLGGSVGFSQQVGQQNQLTRRMFDERESRRGQLRTENAELRAALPAMKDQLSGLQARREAFGEVCPPLDSGEACRGLNRDISAIGGKIKTVEGQIAANTKELEAIGSEAPQLQSTDLSGAGGSSLQNMLSDAMLGKLLETSGFQSPKLHASTMLDNFLQMQYEIIAKQVSLLRDEAVGSDGKPQRLMFLELPQTIYSRQKPWYREQRLAQTYWRITAIHRREPPRSMTAKQAATAAHMADLAERIGETLAEYQNAMNGQVSKQPPVTRVGAFAMAEKDRSPGQPTVQSFIEAQCRKGETELKNVCASALRALETINTFVKAQESSRIGLLPLLGDDVLQFRRDLVGLLASGFLTEEPASGAALTPADRLKFREYLVYIQQDLEALLELLREPADQLLGKCTIAFKDTIVNACGGELQRPEDVVRVVDIVPRQSALNVNEFHATRNTRNLGGFLSLVSGFGAKVNYERRRELYEQFLYQDVFASGFGKGTTRFGWRFGSLPGEKQISPGLRNTYAVVSVPEDAIAIDLTVYGCAMQKDERGLLNPQYGADRSAEHDCSQEERYQVALPNRTVARDAIALHAIRYNSAEPGARVTLLIDGANFGPQTAVLANGVALDRAISVSDMGLPPLDRKRDGLLASGTTKGTFEVVNRNLIAVSLQCDPEFAEVPDLIIQTPEAAMSVRDQRFLSVYANGKLVPSATWWRDAPIYSRPAKGALSLKTADLSSIVPTPPSTANMQAIVTGAFPAGTTFRVNGATVAPTQIQKSFAILEFVEAQQLAEWSLVAYTGDEIKRLTLPNPRPPQRIEECDCSLLATNSEAASERRPSRASIELRGTHFSAAQNPLVVGATIESFSVHSPELATILVRDAARRVRVQLGPAAACVTTCPRQ